MNIEQLCMNKINLTIKFNTNIRLQKKFFQIQVFFFFFENCENYWESII